MPFTVTLDSITQAKQYYIFPGISIYISSWMKIIKYKSKTNLPFIAGLHHGA